MDLKDLAINLESIADPNLRRCIVGLLNIVQQQAEEIARLRAENGTLKDEIARLKGEQGRPNVPPNKPGGGPKHSSENQRKEPKKRDLKCKAIEIDRTQLCPVDRSMLPADAQNKGIETTVIQDVIFRRDNVAFEREKFYSPSEGKTYLGPLPAGYAGYDFGPGVRSLVLVLYYATGASEPKILELLAHAGVQMSDGALSNFLIHDIEKFHDEKSEVQRAGLASSPWQHIDDTGTRVDGVGQHCHIVGNPLFTIYSTRPDKDRLTIIRVLRDQLGSRFRVNALAIAHAAALGVAGGQVSLFQTLPWDIELDEDTFESALLACMPKAGAQTRRKLYEAAAIAAYHAQGEMPVVQTLLGDAAGQFDGITDERALCWVHEGRHYAKLTPFVAAFQTELDAFQDDFWTFYRELRVYAQAPSTVEAIRLSLAFDLLFATKSNYEALSARIARTRENKNALLQVLEHPELPLHNNPAELAARVRVRKRDVSFGPRTAAGARAWDTMQSLVSTTKRLAINVYEYIADRVRGLGKIGRLADTISERAAVLKLGASWALAEPSG